MAGAGRAAPVYVYSVIPRLTQLVREKLTDVKVVEVEYKGMAAVF